MNFSASNLIPSVPRAEFLAGTRDIFPLVIGAVPFGLIFGTLSQGSGLSFAGALGMSAFVFAGSSQFISLGLLAAGASLPLIWLTTFIVNLRHMLYAASLVPYVGRLPQRWKLLIGFWLTDEAYMVAIRRFQAPDDSSNKPWYYVGAALFMYLNWQFCTWLGLMFGQLMPNADEWGLDFAMVATFIGMVIPYLKNRPMAATVVVAGIVALIARNLPHQLGLMVAAIAGISAGMAVDTLTSQNSRRSSS